MIDEAQQLVERIATVGRENPSHPPLHRVEPFRHFFLPDGRIDRARLDDRDGSCTRRELLLRFLILNAVMDQGPDMEGVRGLLIGVTNEMYFNEVRFLHKPLSFFEELGLAIDQILDKHESIKEVRAAVWAAENQSSATRYNLFMDNSKQALNYAVFRWGVPIALPLLLERDSEDEEHRPTVLLDYLESWESAEEMSKQLKNHERYGLGKSIGDKACHLFAKWMVSSFHLSRRAEPSWGDFSYEVPYDSNVGRVLWRTGFLLRLASEEEYRRAAVVQKREGKPDYIRVTNIREMRTIERETLPNHLWPEYQEIAVNHLKSHKRYPQSVKIHRVQHAYLKSSFPTTGLGVADFDDGLIHIGTTYCFNHDKPICNKCPIRELCKGYQSNPRLIKDFET
jgi:hypothetical protein